MSGTQRLRNHRKARPGKGTVKPGAGAEKPLAKPKVAPGITKKDKPPVNPNARTADGKS
jgi:hypothetical protein